MPRLRGLPVAAALALALGAPGCRDPVADRAGGTAAPPAAEALAVRPGAVRTESGAEVVVVGVRRTARDVVQVDLVAVNGSGAGLDLAAEFARGGGLGQAFLLSEDGRARVFVLADERGEPQCSTPAGTLAPGGREALYLRFAAQSAFAHRVTLGLPGLAPLVGLEVPPADGPS
jgi:hypothetical protein